MGWGFLNIADNLLNLTPPPSGSSPPSLLAVASQRQVCCSLAGTSTLDADHCETKTSAERPKSHDVKILKVAQLSTETGRISGPP